MITDALLQLSSAQAVTATAVSTNTIDLGQARDIGVGEDLYIVFNVDATATAAGAATVVFEAIASAASDLSSPVVIGSTAPFAKTDLVAGRAPISVCINPHPTLEKGARYFGARYTVATGPLTAGAFTATVTNSEVTGQKSYPSGFTVM
jgi:hypothetical protein